MQKVCGSPEFLLCDYRRHNATPFPSTDPTGVEGDEVAMAHVPEREIEAAPSVTRYRGRTLFLKWACTDVTAVTSACDYASAISRDPPPCRPATQNPPKQEPRYNRTVSKVPQPTAPTVGFISLGCPKNLVDSEVMMGLLDHAGARLTARP